jgi:hypothetical protein
MLPRASYYGRDDVPETTVVVNPAYRTLDGQVRKTIGRLSRKIAEFGAINLEGEIEPRKMEAFAQRKADLQDSITQLQTDVDELNPFSPIGVVLGVAPIVDQWVSRKGLHYTGLWGTLGTAPVAMRGGGCGGKLSLSCSMRRRSSGSGWV